MHVEHARIDVTAFSGVTEKITNPRARPSTRIRKTAMDLEGVKQVGVWRDSVN